MRPALLACACVWALASMTAAAQDAPNPPRPLIGGHGEDVKAFIAQYDDNGDGRVAWSEFDAARRARFNATDANGDGVVDEEEYVEEFKDRSRQAMEQERQAQVQQTRVRFAALDANKDGQVSRAEFDASGARVLADIQALVNSAGVDAAPGPARRAADAPGDGTRLGMPSSHSRAGLLELYDADGDGRISQAEFERAREAQFRRTDANGNGVLDQDEYVAEFEDRMDRHIAAAVADDKQTHVRFGVLDANKDGRMTFEEYQVSGRRTFDRVDRNHDGSVDAADAALPPPPREGVPASPAGRAPAAAPRTGA